MKKTQKGDLSFLKNKGLKYGLYNFTKAGHLFTLKNKIPRYSKIEKSSSVLK